MTVHEGVGPGGVRLITIDTSTGATSYQLPSVPASGLTFQVRHSQGATAATVTVASGKSIDDVTDATKTIAVDAEMFFLSLDAGAWQSYGGASGVTSVVGQSGAVTGATILSDETVAAALAAKAPTLSSAGTVLPNTEAKLATIASSPPAALRVLTFGDSYAQKVYGAIWPTVAAIAGGPAGAYNGQVSTIGGGITRNSTSGTVTDNTTDFTRWPSGATTTLAASATATYGSGGGNLTGDKIKVYYALEPGAGTFKIQVDGVDASGFTNISAVGTLGQLGTATVTTTAGTHTFTLVGLTGSVTIVTIGYENSTVSGVITMAVGQGGVALNSPTSTAWSNFQAFLADALPDLMTYEAKENSSYFATSLATLFAATAAGAPNMDVLAIGSPPVSSGDADQVIQNTQLRTAASAAGYTYWDSYAPFGSYARLNALGMAGDGTHVSTAADQFRGMLMLRDTGLLAGWGRNVWQGGVRLPQVTIARASNQNSAGVIAPESSAGLDLQARANRWFSVTDLATATEVARIDAAGTGTTYLPNSFRVGSATALRLNAAATDRLIVQQGANSNHADIQVRSVINPTSAQSVSGSVTCDLSATTFFVLTLTGNVTAFAFSNAGQSGQLIEVEFVQDGTGSRTLAGSAAPIKWAGAAAPTLTTTASRRDIFVFRQISGGYYEVCRSMNVG